MQRSRNCRREAHPLTKDVPVSKLGSFTTSHSERRGLRPLPWAEPTPKDASPESGSVSVPVVVAPEPGATLSQRPPRAATAMSSEVTAALFPFDLTSQCCLWRQRLIREARVSCDGATAAAEAPPAAKVGDQGPGTLPGLGKTQMRSMRHPPLRNWTVSGSGDSQETEAITASPPSAPSSLPRVSRPWLREGTQVAPVAPSGGKEPRNRGGHAAGVLRLAPQKGEVAQRARPAGHS